MNVSTTPSGKRPPTGPDGLPILSRGQHLDPRDGACVMETVSLLAGEPWSDRPRCTPPALAELARMVNDSSPPDAYPRLARLAPDLIGERRRDPRVTPTVLLTCMAELRRCGLQPGPVLRLHERVARRRLVQAGRSAWPSRLWALLTDPVYRAGPARHATAGAVYRLANSAPDRAAERLPGLLATAITECRALRAQQPAAARDPAAVSSSRSR